MTGILEKMLFKLAFFSIAASPATLLASSWIGIAPFAIIGGFGFACSGLLVLMALLAVEVGRIPLASLKRSGAFILYCGLVILSLLRSPPVSAQFVAASRFALMSLLLALTCLILLSASIRDRETRLGLITAAMTGASLLPVTMLLFDVLSGSAPLHLQAWQSGIRVLETTLIASPNTNSLLGALGAIAGIWLVIKKKRKWAAAAVAVGIYYVVITQSKGVAFSLGLAALHMILARGLSPAFVRLVLVVWVLSAPLQIIAFSAVEGTGIGQVLTRAEGSHLGVGTGRSLIWTAALGEIGSNPAAYVLGTGYSSAPTTSVLTASTMVFSPEDVGAMYQRTYSLHNAALQVLFDAGVISLVLLVYCLSVTLSSARFPGVDSVILFILLSGLNEAIGTVYSIFSALPFLALLCAHCVGNDTGQPESPKSRRQGSASENAVFFRLGVDRGR